MKIPHPRITHSTKKLSYVARERTQEGAVLRFLRVFGIEKHYEGRELCRAMQQQGRIHFTNSELPEWQLETTDNNTFEITKSSKKGKEEDLVTRNLYRMRNAMFGSSQEMSSRDDDEAPFGQLISYKKANNRWVWGYRLAQ